MIWLARVVAKEKRPDIKQDLGVKKEGRREVELCTDENPLLRTK